MWKPDIPTIEGSENVYLLRGAYRHAWTASQDPVTKTGALIVNSNLETVSIAANCFPRGLNPSPDQVLDRNWKYEHIIHAESGAVLAAARQGRSTEGTIMYMPWVPCVSCAKVIIGAGVRKLIGHQPLIEQTPERWWEDTGRAIDLLKKCGVDVAMYSGPIGEVRSLFNGIEWAP